MRIWDAVRGECLEVLQSLRQSPAGLAAILAGPPRVRFRALPRPLEVEITDASAAIAVAWLPHELVEIVPLGDGRAFAALGAHDRQLYLFSLETGEP